MHLFWTLLIGFLAGAIGKIFVPGNQPKGCLITTALGIIGSVVATYLGQFLGIYQAGEPAGFLGAIIGVMIVLLIYREIKGN